MCFVGIDWAEKKHDVGVIAEAARKVAHLRVTQTPEGLAKLGSFLKELAPLDQLVCLLESKHGLLMSALLEAGGPL